MFFPRCITLTGEEFVLVNSEINFTCALLQSTVNNKNKKMILVITCWNAIQINVRNTNSFLNAWPRRTGIPARHSKIKWIIFIRTHSHTRRSLRYLKEVKFFTFWFCVITWEFWALWGISPRIFLLRLSSSLILEHLTFACLRHHIYRFLTVTS